MFQWLHLIIVVLRITIMTVFSDLSNPGISFEMLDHLSVYLLFISAVPWENKECLRISGLSIFVLFPVQKLYKEIVAKL